MAEENHTAVGNKMSLRSTEMSRIMRISAISDSTGKLGELLVTTLAGLLMGALIGAGLIVIDILIIMKRPETIGANIIPIIGTILASLMLTLNIIFTNPALGSQFAVSMSYLYNRVKNFRTRNMVKRIDNMRVSKDFPELVEQHGFGSRHYIIAFSVRGVVSRVSFENDLAIFHSLSARLLRNLEQSTQLTCINNVSSADVQPMKLPENATEMMKARATEIYEYAKNAGTNQQLTTLVVLSSQNPTELLNHADLAENALHDGLSVGYTRLTAKQAKKEIKSIYD